MVAVATNWRSRQTEGNRRGAPELRMSHARPARTIHQTLQSRVTLLLRGARNARREQRSPCALRKYTKGEHRRKVKLHVCLLLVEAGCARSCSRLERRDVDMRLLKLFHWSKPWTGHKEGKIRWKVLEGGYRGRSRS